jgi:hypothetical protein
VISTLVPLAYVLLGTSLVFALDQRVSDKGLAKSTLLSFVIITVFWPVIILKVVWGRILKWLVV